MRRLPIFLVIDVSESMVGQPLRQMQEGISRLIETLRRDPYALETVYLSVIAFAGMCSVSGETDDTFASQIHLFLALFHRAKASWVSYRCLEVPALVLTVTCCGVVDRMGATKFARRGLLMRLFRVGCGWRCRGLLR